jgi:hypothetical protein
VLGIAAWTPVALAAGPIAGGIGGVGEVAANAVVPATHATAPLTPTVAPATHATAPVTQATAHVAPAVATATRPVTSKVAPASGDVTQAVAPVTQAVTSKVAPASGDVTQAVAPVTQAVTSTIAPATEDVTQAVAPATQAVTSTIAPATEDVTQAVAPVTQAVTSTVAPVAQAASQSIAPVTSAGPDFTGSARRTAAASATSLPLGKVVAHSVGTAATGVTPPGKGIANQVPSTTASPAATSSQVTSTPLPMAGPTSPTVPGHPLRGRSVANTLVSSQSLLRSFAASITVEPINGAGSGSEVLAKTTTAPHKRLAPAPERTPVAPSSPGTVASSSAGSSTGFGFTLFLLVAGLLMLVIPQAMRRMRLASESRGLAPFLLIPDRPG